LIVEARARLAIDERDLWPARRFVTALVVCRREYLERARENVSRALSVHRDEVARLGRAEPEARALVAGAIARSLGRPLPPAVLAGCWSRCDFTDDPLVDSLAAQARASQSLGFLPAGSLADLRPVTV
jgi:NitT/TauT family transport system substrate-binding protein